MRFNPPLISGILRRRYQRFLADIELASGKIVTAHCPNPGAMLGITQPGYRVWVSHQPSEKERKLAYRWELVEAEGTVIGLNTQRPNSLVQEALQGHQIPELLGYSTHQREVRYGQNSRIDFLLKEPGKPACYLEIKNVHYKRDKQGKQALFPDSVTTRGAKHLRELAHIRTQGARAVVLYVVQRADCDSFSLAADIDPMYAHAAQDAKQQGVEALCYACQVTTEGITLTRPLPVVT